MSLFLMHELKISTLGGFRRAGLGFQDSQCILSCWHKPSSATKNLPNYFCPGSLQEYSDDYGR